MITLTIMLGFLGGIGGTELIVIGAIILLMFGGKKIPEMMKGMGKGIKEFKNASEGVELTEDEKNI